MSRLLLLPLSPLYNTLATEIAGKVVYMSFVLPVTVVLGLWLRPALDVAGWQLLAFLPALLLAWLLRFFWGYWLALLAFWATRADALLALQDSLIFLLAGQVAPVALLPGMLQVAAKVLPFRYMIAFPVEVVTGALDPAEMALGFALQLGWLALALGLYRFFWVRGVQQYTAVGG